MPNLDFYAGAIDLPAVLEFALARDGARLLESYSRPAKQLREFTAVSDVVEALGASNGALGLMLYAASMRGRYEVERFALLPGAFPGSPAWRERIKGWGLIQLELRLPTAGKLRPCHTNHNTWKRATAWAGSYPDQDPPDNWDFEEVARISSQLNRYVRRHLAVASRGSRPVLREAWAAVTAGALTLADN